VAITFALRDITPGKNAFHIVPRFTALPAGALGLSLGWPEAFARRLPQPATEHSNRVCYGFLFDINRLKSLKERLLCFKSRFLSDINSLSTAATRQVVVPQQRSASVR
jgi:hypothetical protein